MKRILLLSAFLFSISVFATNDPILRMGEWRGVLLLNDTTELPFTFEIAHPGTSYSDPFFLTVKNAGERIVVEDFRFGPDSVSWRMPVFDSWFRCKYENDTAFSGMFYNRSASRPYELKFRAEFGKKRFNVDNSKYGGFRKIHDINGKWECTFSPGLADSSKAIGIFSRDKHGIVTGTFLTETGDYRYLEGEEDGDNEVMLSCFDGSHAFLFKARWQAGGSLKGQAWYGKYGHEEWTGFPNEKFQLRDPEKLTWITDSTNVNFTFNDLNGKPVSLSDPQFAGKVVIIQVMGSWCPNCMDETAWMAEIYKKYHKQGLEVIALAYERSTDTAKANPNIRRVRDRFGAEYTFLNTGKSGKDAASASLPFLNGIMSFPTTIYIDRTGNVRRVYTGFNGPATGAAYLKDTAEAERFIQQLLAQKKK
jgi:thiol-disulfide isomerase/thioredoxin